MTNVLKREGKGRKTVAQRDGHVETEGRLQLLPKAKERLKSAEAGRDTGRYPSLEGAWPVNILVWDFWPPESWKNTVLLF